MSLYFFCRCISQNLWFLSKVLVVENFSHLPCMTHKKGEFFYHLPGSRKSINLIPRRVCGHSMCNVLSPGTYSHTWVFPSVRVVLSVTCIPGFVMIMDYNDIWLTVDGWLSTSLYFFTTIHSVPCIYAYFFCLILNLSDHLLKIENRNMRMPKNMENIFLLLLFKFCFYFPSTFHLLYWLYINILIIYRN